MPSIYSGLMAIVDRIRQERVDPEFDVDRVLANGRPENWSRTMGGEVATLTGSAAEDIHGAIERASRRLIDLQRPEGLWVGELEANVALAAQYIMCRRYIGQEDVAEERKIVAYLREMQNEVGGWPIFYGGPPDLSVTIDAYFASKLAGVSPDEPYMRRARDLILASGGVEAAKCITKIYLALFGQFPWRGTPALPITFMLMPRGFPLSLYEMSYWARTCVVPLLILWDKKPQRNVPPERGVLELYRGDPKAVPSMPKDYRGSPLWSWRNFFVQSDRILKVLDRSPIRFHRRYATRCAERWVIEHQDEDGGWGGIFPAITHSIMALHALGHGPDHPTIRKGLQALKDLQIEENGMLRLQPCVSPVWDTAWSVVALSEAGMSADSSPIQRATDWLVERQIRRPGDWSVKARGVPAGGWAFQFYNDWYPDTDDTSVVLLALLCSKDRADGRHRASFDLAIRWLLGLQNSDGGWGAFERENNNRLFDEILFNDDRNMLDPSTVDVTGRIIEALGRMGWPVNDGLIERARSFIHAEQEHDGKWWGRWGVNYIYGTWSVLCGLRALGNPDDIPFMRKAAAWLRGVQNPDGGWGETCRSYDSVEFAASGPSTPSQTAWALLGLLAAGEGGSEEASRGVAYLLATQREDGDWDEQEFTGTGFPRAFYLRYHMYRLYFPLLALARYKNLVPSE